MKEIEARYQLSNYTEEMKQCVRAAGITEDEGSYSKAINDFKVAAVDLHSGLSALRKREACEMVLWGKAEQNTLEETAFFEARLRHLPDIARRAIRKEE